MKKLICLYMPLFLIVSVSLIACGGSGGESVSPSPPVTPVPIMPPSSADTIGLVTLDNLTSGMCADVIDQTNGVEFLLVKNCDEEHQFEIAGNYDLDGFGDEYPGNIAIDRRVHQDCRPLFESHTGQTYTGRGLGIDTITPSVSSWRNGDRSVICLVVNADRSLLNGSVAR